MPLVRKVLERSPELAAFKGVAWSPDGRSVAAVANRKLLLVPLDGGKIKSAAISGNGGALAFSPDGARLYAGEEKLAAYDVVTWKRAWEKKHKYALRSIVSCRYDGASFLHVFDAATGTQVSVERVDLALPFDLAVSPDGQRAALAARDGVYEWFLDGT